MKIFELKKEQLLPIKMEEAWDFFSSPRNLKKITPSYMGFSITTKDLASKMYAGQIISYIVKPVLGIPLKWTTEITHVKDREYFVDEQRFGPYALWHHQHWFEETKEGVLMKDHVSYALPLGFLGRMANAIFVRKQLETIFEYRKKVTSEIFKTEPSLR